MGPRFERIPCETEGERVHQLEQLLMKRLPDSVHILVILKLAWQKRFPPEVNVQLYIYTDDEMEELNEDDNPFIVCIQRPNFHSKKGIAILCPRRPTDLQISTFETFLGWDEPMVFGCTPEPIWPTLCLLCRLHGKLLPEGQEGIPCQFYAITDLEKAKSIDASDFDDHPSLTVRRLEKSDASTIVDLWMWAAPHTEEVIRNCVGHLSSCGVFDNGEVASFVLFSPLGLFNALFTPEKFRNRGLGKFVMRWITRETAREVGTFPLVEVGVENEAGKRIVKGVGFEEMYLTKWIYYEPK